jgi:TRAP-type C4-dicarboxylate transport system permease small subunit
MERISNLYGKLLAGLALLSCLLLFLMMLIICGDVLLRNVKIVPGLVGLEWANQVSESLLFLMTMLAAPWILRRGQHIRVDIMLRALPKKTAWYCEWLADIVVLACCAYMTAYSWKALVSSYSSGSLAIKTLVTPEWWSLAPLPFSFMLLTIEMLFRMQRLHAAERGPRDDAVSAA